MLTTEYEPMLASIFKAFTGEHAPANLNEEWPRFFAVENGYCIALALDPLISVCNRLNV